MMFIYIPYMYSLFSIFYSLFSLFYKVYKQNEERLSSVGTKTLENMLYDRNWSSLPWLNSRAAKPIKDASVVDINWKTISPLHFSVAPQHGSDLSQVAPEKCPFTSPGKVRANFIIHLF